MKILTILILNAVVGVSQESSAEKAIAALQEYSANEAKVIRNGHVSRIRAEELVPGDIIDVAVGDRIPADCRVIAIMSNTFRVDQAILTGESESVSKNTRPVKDSMAVKQDQTNMLFSGTAVTVGHARAVVVLTGNSTAIGDIHTSIVSQISEPTPLKQKLNDFGDVLAKVISVICVIVWLINIRNFSDESHGGWLKGAIYYLKVIIIEAMGLQGERLTDFDRSLFHWESLPFQRVLLWSSQPVSPSGLARWLQRTLLSGVCLRSRPSEAVVLFALIRLEP